MFRYHGKDVCQFDDVHSAAGADLFNSMALCQEFILYQSTTGHLYVPQFVSIIMLGFNNPFQ